VALNPLNISGSYATASVGSGIDVTVNVPPTVSATRRRHPGLRIYGRGVSDDPIGTIDRAALTITAANQAKTYGQSLGLGTTAFTTSTLFNNDMVTGVTLASAGAAATADGRRRALRDRAVERGRQTGLDTTRLPMPTVC